MSNITYEWKIMRLEVADSPDFQNVVVQTYWNVKGTDENGNEGNFPGGMSFSIKDIDANNFKPYNDLTEEEIILWIKKRIDGFYQENIESTIKKQIEKKKSNLREKPFPWA